MGISTRFVPDTSREAYKLLEDRALDDWLRIVLPVLEVEELSSYALAKRTGKSYHWTERRVSRALNEGYLMRGNKVQNETGRTAYAVKPSGMGLQWLRGGPRPLVTPDARQATQDLLSVACTLSDVEAPDWDLLRDAVLRYRHATDPHSRDRELRRLGLIRVGYWLRGDDSIIELEAMLDVHLLGAVRVRRRLALQHDPILNTLVQEARRRGLAV